MPLSSPLAQGPGPFPAGLPSPCCHTPDGLDHPCRGTLHCPFVSHFRTSRLSSRREACQGPSCSRDGGEGDRHHVQVRTSPRPCLVLSSVSVLWWSAVLAKGCTRRLRFHLDLRASPPLPNQGPRARRFSLRLTWSQAGSPFNIVPLFLRAPSQDWYRLKVGLRSDLTVDELDPEDFHQRKVFACRWVVDMLGRRRYHTTSIETCRLVSTAGSCSQALTKSRGAPAPSPRPLLEQGPCICCGFADWLRCRLAVELEVGGMMRPMGQMEAVMLEPSSGRRFSSSSWVSSLIKRSNTYLQDISERSGSRNRPSCDDNNPLPPDPSPADPTLPALSRLPTTRPLGPSGLDGATLTRPAQPPMPTRHDLAEPQHGPASSWRVTLPLKLKTDVFIGA